MNDWLYTYELAGKSYDKNTGTEYEMVLVSKWSDRTEKAKEIDRKCFYFSAKQSQIRELLSTEEEVKNLFQKTNYAKFGIVKRIEIKRIY